MTETTDLQQKLLQTVKGRLDRVNFFIKDQEQRSGRLTNMAIIFAASSAVLTAGPALGRDNFVKSMQSLFNVPDANIWGILCLLAMLLSIATAVIGNMTKSHETADRLTKALAARTLLEKLATSLEFEHLPVPDATKMYQDYIDDIPFIP